MINVYSPPEYPYVKGLRSIFLGGSIEMGKARDWQKEFIGYARKHLTSYDYHILNPRRADWDNTWKQSVEDGSFYQQVEWELSYLEQASFKVFCFCSETTSPISLLEFGRHATLDPYKVYLHVEDGYGRKGNLDVFCHKFDIKKYESLEDIAKSLMYK